MPANQMRLDPVTKHWVLYAPARSHRPHEYVGKDKGRTPLPPHDAACPFCPGNEEHLAGIEMESPSESVAWATRVVPNRYPARPSGLALSINRVRGGGTNHGSK